MASSTTFNDLPTELKLYILSFFDCYTLNEKVAKICKNWRFLSSDPSKWRKLKIIGTKRSSEQITAIINRNQFIGRLILHGIQDFDWLNNISKHTSLRRIKLSFSQLSKSIVLQLINLFPNIEHVDIVCCYNIESDVILQMTHWNFLDTFKINGHKYDDLPNCISLFAKRTKRLQAINLGMCKISTETFNDLIKSRGECLKFLRVPYLELNGGNCQLFTTTCVNLTELRIRSPILMPIKYLLELTNLPSLKILQLIRCNELFSTDFPSVFKGAKFASLTELVIKRSTNFDDECLEAFVKCCPALTDLHVSLLGLKSSLGLNSLPIICSKLQLLILVGIEGITRSYVDEIVGQLLNLCYCFALKCPQISDGMMCKIVDNPKSRMCVSRNMCSLYG